MDRRPRLFRGSAAAFVVSALIASVLLLTHPSGSASAAVYTGPSVTVVHGCDVGDGLGDWVEATIHPGTQVIDPGQPDVLQVGLARTADNQDSYLDDSGPILVDFTGKTETVRLSGPIRGAHVFLRQYGGTAYTNTPFPAACQHEPKTDFDLAAPEVIGSGSTANCVSSNAVLNVTLWNEGDVDADYTVLLVKGGTGQLIGSNPQGELHTVKAHSQELVKVAQPYQSTTTTYQFQVRVLAQDGSGVTAGNRPVQCDSQGHKGPRPTRSPLPPPSQNPSSPPSSSGQPSSTPTTTSARPHPSSSSTAARSSQAPVTARSTSAAAVGSVVSGGSNSDQNPGSTSTDTGGAVLGDADATRQPSQPAPSSKPSSKQALVEPAAVVRGVTSGMGAAAALILLVFAGAIGGMVAANRASARRR